MTDKMITSITAVALAGLGILAYYIGAHEIGLMLVGVGIGYPIQPGRGVPVGPVLGLAAILAVSTLGGCTAAEQSAARDTLKPVIKVTCAIARRVVQACPYVESAVGATAGGEDE